MMQISDRKTVMSIGKAKRVVKESNRNNPQWACYPERVHASTFFPVGLAIIRVHDSENGSLLGWL
jgi:hypothetical protein